MYAPGQECGQEAAGGIAARCGSCSVLWRFFYHTQSQSCSAPRLCSHACTCARGARKPIPPPPPNLHHRRHHCHQPLTPTTAAATADNRRQQPPPPLPCCCPAGGRAGLALRHRRVVGRRRRQLCSDVYAGTLLRAAPAAGTGRGGLLPGHVVSRLTWKIFLVGC